MKAADWGHPTLADYTGKTRVTSPCCRRKEASERIYDIRMVPKERRPLGQPDFVCETCINHSVLNLRITTYGQLAKDMGAPQKYIDSATLLDAGIEANRNR